jgi:hypothetical protein
MQMKRDYRLVWCIALAALLIGFGTAHAQVVSPRTGELPKRQLVTMEAFNQLPPEVQVIMKQHPELYTISEGRKAVVVSQADFDLLPVEQQDYMREVGGSNAVAPAAPASNAPTSVDPAPIDEQ